MSAEEPDLAGLFAPVDVADVMQGVLGEARAALAHLDDPVDAELWTSDMIGALSTAAGGEDEAAAALVEKLVPAAEEASTPEALALLRVLAAVGSPEVRAAAGQAADRVAAQDVADIWWATVIGSPQVLDCWHYADVGGRQESVTLAFAYGDQQHGLSVLIDHGRGGKIKDIWLAKGPDLLFSTELAAATDPLVVFEVVGAADARERLDRAVAAGEGPEQPDQVDDIVAHRALLRARLELLSG
jgi:hypothetical protein